MLGLGFADNIDEVKAMIDVVDTDKSQRVEFPEFLAIIRNGDASEKTRVMTQFFKDLTTGAFGQKSVSFPLFVCSERRQYLKNAIYSTEEAEKKKGMHIMENIKA